MTRREHQQNDLMTTREAHEKWLAVAIEEAEKGLSEGGIPIGSVLVVNSKLVGRGHNRRVQKQSCTLHGEMGKFSLDRFERSPLSSDIIAIINFIVYVMLLRREVVYSLIITFFPRLLGECW